MKIRKLPSRESLWLLFDYVDSAERVVNGFLMRGALLRKSTGRLVFGSITEDPRSRAAIGLPNNTVFYLHRVIWVMHHGEPEKGLLVDHEDGDAGHNRISNFRLLTNAQNQMNRRKARTGSAVRYIGVSKHKDGFAAYSAEDGKPVYLGTYPTPEEAARIRDKEAERRHGSVARLNRDLFGV